MRNYRAQFTIPDGGGMSMGVLAKSRDHARQQAEEWAASLSVAYDELTIATELEEQKQEEAARLEWEQRLEEDRRAELQPLVDAAVEKVLAQREQEGG